MSRPPRLSVTIITLNEQHNLRELLMRLSWVDEIVIVDSGSRDRTVLVARAAGARVIERPFVDFADQRNHALAAARGRWVWSIDADERPTRELCDEIRNIVARGRQNGYRIRIHSSIFGRRMRFGGMQDDRPVRLVLRGAARWVGGVHEVLRVDGGAGELRGILHHRTLPDLNAFMRKMHHYTTLGAKARLSESRAPRPVDLVWPPIREVARRLIWKLGFLDGPRGWAFACLSGWSEWVLARKHRQLWHAAGDSSANAMQKHQHQVSRLGMPIDRLVDDRQSETRSVSEGPQLERRPSAFAYASGCEQDRSSDLFDSIEPACPQ